MAVIANAGTAIPPEVTNAQKLYSANTQAGGISPYYQIVLDVRGNTSTDSSGKKVFPIVAALGDKFNMQMTSDWTTPLSSMGGMSEIAGNLGGSGVGSAVNALSQLAGIHNVNKYMSIKVWQGTSGVNFSFDLFFNAYTNPLNDVQAKHKALLKLIAPIDLGNGILGSPGPTPWDTIETLSGATAKNRIDLYIGNFIVLQNVIINSVSADIDCLFADRGIPIAASINIGVSTMFDNFTDKDIDSMYVNN